MKWKWDWNWGFWVVMIVGLALIWAFIIGAAGNLALNEALTRRAELPRNIESFEAGPVTITDVRTGTEFMRIIQGQNGQVIIKSGWINRWGEHQIRVRDDSW